jgi:hypothetical protein
MLASIFEELASLKRVNSKRWASNLGKLRFVLVAIPGSAGRTAVGAEQGKG